MLSFALDWLLVGDHPFWFHTVNLGFHFAASLGVGILAQMLVKRPFAGLIAGMVFALHPAHPEAVVWVSGRIDVLCGALLVWSFVCYIKGKESGIKPGRFLSTLSIVLFGLACLSKEQAFVFPLLILLYEFFPLGDPTRSDSPSAKLKQVAPFFLLTVVLFCLRWPILGGIGGYIPEENKEQLYANALYFILLQPFIVLLVPINRTIAEGAGELLLVITMAIVLSPLLMTLRARWRILVFCAISIMICMVPSAHLGVVEGSLQNSRFLYTPSVFFAILIASLFTGEFQGRFRTVVSALAVVYCLTLLLSLHQNNYAWQNAGTLVRTASASTDRLVERHEGEWGTEKQKLLAFNVPTNFLGAWTFRNGFSDMLLLRHGDEMEGVEIEVIYGGIQSPENIQKIEHEMEAGSVIWLFDDRTWMFVENAPRN